VTAQPQLSEWELDSLAFAADEAVEPLVDFAARIVPRLYPQIPELPDHWRQILDVFERTRHGDQRWCINLPPRHGKTVCGLLAIAWQMQNWPTLRHAYATYGQDFSETQGRTMRKILALAGVRLSAEKADVFETPEGGAVYFTSRDSPLLGKGISGILLIDDPYKNDKEAASPVVIETVWDWWHGTARSRLEGPASVVLMHQRWNVDDMTGRLEEARAGWGKLVIKAINDNGEALWPATKSLKELRSIERENPFVFSSMYQQDPIPRGSTIFREPDRFDLDEWLTTLEPLQYRWVLALDPAVTAEASADHSAAVLMAMRGAGDDAEAWVVDLLHEQIEAPELAERVVEMRRAWRRRHGIAVLPIAVEGVGVGKAVYQVIRKLIPGDSVVPVPAAADKKARALPFAAAWNDQRVHVPLLKNGEKWSAYVREHRRFTGLKGGKDDQVDAGAHGWNREFRRQPALKRGPRALNVFDIG
jgi:predicted phage terminase large subunit-like protein